MVRSKAMHDIWVGEARVPPPTSVPQASAVWADWEPAEGLPRKLITGAFNRMDSFQATGSHSADSVGFVLFINNQHSMTPWGE